MSIQSRITGGKKRNEALVTDLGQLVTAPFAPSIFYLGSTAVNDVPVNVVAPRKKNLFIITSIILSSDRSVGANGAVTTIYENGIGPTDTTQDKVIITEEIAKQTRMTAIGVNIEVSEGKWINVVSDDVIVRCNIAGYFVGAV